METRVTTRQTKAFKWNGTDAKGDDGSLPFGFEIDGYVSGKYFIVDYGFWGNMVNPPYAILLADTIPVVVPEPPATDIVPPDEFTARWLDADGNPVVTREYKRV